MEVLLPRREYLITSTAHSAADPDTVYALVSDAPRWSSWAGPLVPRSRWISSGDTGTVGAVRELGLWPVLVRERVTAAQPGVRHAYALVSGVPVRDYTGEITLTGADGGTDISWQVRFAEPLPGTGRALHLAVRTLIGALTTRLAKAR